jgi:adenosylcobinamide-GDP ribazoletransferase
MRAADDLVAATAFLTRVPVGRAVEVDGRAVARAAPLYPLVGGAIGALGGAVVDLTAGPLTPFAAAALGLTVVALLTGGMHLDALADTADALGGTTRPTRLEIMRDHAIGSFGGAALVLVLLFEASLLAAEESAWSAFAAAAACARWTPLPLGALLPYARSDGQGAALAGTRWTQVLVGLAIASAIALGVRGPEGLAAVAAAAVTALVLGAFFRRWIGGVTGDALGAATELAQAAALAAVFLA